MALLARVAFAAVGSVLANALTNNGRQGPMAPNCHTTNNKLMNIQNLASEITLRLINCGVKLIELPGGSIQLHGKYGTKMLTQDISTLRQKHIDQLCGTV